MIQVPQEQFDTWLAGYPRPLRAVPVPAGGGFGKRLYYDGQLLVGYVLDRSQSRAPRGAVTFNDYFITES
jgi:hypothetical protein